LSTLSYAATRDGKFDGSALPQDNKSGQVLVYQLSVVPECRKKILEMQINLMDAQPLKDAWGTPMQYRYYKYDSTYSAIPARGGFGGMPVIISAGPDKTFGGAADNDNIRSDKQ
jgi:hypothetical protein